MKEIVIYIISIIITLILSFNQPMPVLFTITLASLIICVITIVFINRKYQDKFLYFTSLGIIIGLVLISAYFQFSARLYNDNVMFDYIYIGIILLVSYLLYDLILKMADYNKKIRIYDNALKTY